MGIEDIGQEEQTFGEQLSLFQQLFDAMPIPVFYKDSKGLYRSCNKAFERCTGLKRDEIIGKSLTEILPATLADYYKKMDDVLLGDLPGGQMYEASTRFADGTERELSVYKAAHRDAEGKVAGLVGIIVDNTEQKRAEEALRESENNFKSLAEKSILGVFIEQDGLFKYVNQRFAEMHGYTVDEMVDRLGSKDLVLPEDLPFLAANGNKTLEGKTQSTQPPFRASMKDGTTVHLEVYTSSMTYKGRPAVIGTLLDVTERVKTEETIRRMAYCDALTGLPNRSLFFDPLNVAITSARRTGQLLGLMMLDLDRFKMVNDTMGHDAGDELLKFVGERIETVLRRSDTVARMGGDEFLVLLPEVARVEDSLVVAQKILEAFQEPFSFRGQTPSVTTSIGIASFPEDGEDGETLIKNADNAMYAAKMRGRNRIVQYKEVRIGLLSERD
jgi:diguanylate cyclase (GGDEF)-like protein/PAS domain S-box-containing protein